MWESFYAFNDHRKKAHLIFRTTEPFYEETESDYEPTEKDSTSPDSQINDLEGEPKTKLTMRPALAQHQLQIMANKISHILASDKISDEVKEAFTSILFEAGSESGIGGTAHPELVKTALPLIINTLDFNYGRGFVTSLCSLLDSWLVQPIENELRQYEKRFDGKTQDELKVLDLSKSSVEDLAVTLSGLMHNPNLPKPIKDCLENNLNVSHTDFYTPENILGNLKEMSEE